MRETDLAMHRSGNRGWNLLGTHHWMCFDVAPLRAFVANRVGWQVAIGGAYTWMRCARGDARILEFCQQIKKCVVDLCVSALRCSLLSQRIAL